MMGLPCLRWNGAFFASCDRRTGDLLVKLAESRVDELVASGRANSFAPAGRRFREWAAVPDEPITNLEASARRSPPVRDRPSRAGEEVEQAVTLFTGFPAKHGSGRTVAPADERHPR